MEKIKLYETRDLGQNIRVCTQFIKQNFGVMIKVLSFFIPIFLIISFLQSDVENSSPYNSKIIIIYYTAQFLTSLFTTLFVISYTYVYSNEDEVSIREVLNRVKLVYLPAFLISLIYVFLFSFAFVLCIVPGIVLSVYCCFCIYIYVIERCGIIECFKRSFYLVKDNWWTTFLYLIIVSFIAYGISFIFTLPHSIIYISRLFKVDIFEGSIYNFATICISYIGQLFVMLIFQIACCVYYYSLKNKVMGLDTIREIGSIGNIKEYE